MIDKIDYLKKYFFDFDGLNINEDISIILKKIRLALRLTQDEMAQLLNISFATVNRIELKKHIPQFYLQAKIKKIATDLLELHKPINID